MDIISGKIASPQKIVVYGPEGIGKSTFASRFPDPLFIDTEGSTKHLNVKRFEKPLSWSMLEEQIRYVIDNRICKTLVIDTADWAERLCITDICARYKKNGIEDFGYGNGYVYLMEQYGKLLNLLEDIIDVGINVVLNAHAVMRKFEQPDEVGSYDRWELKLTRKVAPIVKEWADMILFANYKTFAVAVDDKGTKHKAQGGKRVMYTTHHPCWDAKNRHDLHEEIPFDYEQIRHCIEIESIQQTQSIEENTNTHTISENINSAPEMTEKDFETPPFDFGEDVPNPTLKQLMQENSVTGLEIRKAVAYKRHFPQETPIVNYPPDYVEGVLIGAWNQVFDVIKNMRENYPF